LLDDYLAELTIQRGRRGWVVNHDKIDYVLEQARPYIQQRDNERHAVCANPRALEVGLGDGYLMDRLCALGLSYTGVDVSHTLIEHHQQRARASGLDATLICASAAELRVTPGSIDVAFALDVLEHLSAPDYVATLARLHAALAEGGVLVGTVPYRENLVDSLVCCPECGHEFHRVGHRQAFDWTYLRDTLERHFDILRIAMVQPIGRWGLTRRLGHVLTTPARRVKHWLLARHDPQRVLDAGGTCYFIARRRPGRDRPPQGG
jgi:SAM-dependent methyltransferase